MLHQKIFEKLHTAMAISVLFEQILGKFVIFLAPTVSASPTMMHFVRTALIIRA